MHGTYHHAGHQGLRYSLELQRLRIGLQPALVWHAEKQYDQTMILTGLNQSV